MLPTAAHLRSVSIIKPVRTRGPTHKIEMADANPRGSSDYPRSLRRGPRVHARVGAVCPSQVTGMAAHSCSRHAARESRLTRPCRAAACAPGPWRPAAPGAISAAPTAAKSSWARSPAGRPRRRPPRSRRPRGRRRRAAVGAVGGAFEEVLLERALSLAIMPGADGGRAASLAQSLGPVADGSAHRDDALLLGGAGADARGRREAAPAPRRHRRRAAPRGRAARRRRPPPVLLPLALERRLLPPAARLAPRRPAPASAQDDALRLASIRMAASFASALPSISEVTPPRAPRRWPPEPRDVGHPAEPNSRSSPAAALSSFSRESAAPPPRRRPSSARLRLAPRRLRRRALSARCRLSRRAAPPPRAGCAPPPPPPFRAARAAPPADETDARRRRRRLLAAAQPRRVAAKQPGQRRAARRPPRAWPARRLPARRLGRGVLCRRSTAASA